MTDSEAVVNLTKNQEEMLYFLRHATEDFPLDLSTGFDLGEPRHRTTLYREAIELVPLGFIKEKYRKGHESKYWITGEGEAALRAIHHKIRVVK